MLFAKARIRTRDLSLFLLFSLQNNRSRGVTYKTQQKENMTFFRSRWESSPGLYGHNVGF